MTKKSGRLGLTLLGAMLLYTTHAYALSYNTDTHRFVWGESITTTATDSMTGRVSQTSGPATSVKSPHFTELSDAIDYAMGNSVCNVPDAWANVDPSVRAAIGASGGRIYALHLNALQTAVGALYTGKGQPVPAAIQVNVSAGEKLLRTHIQDLRDALDYLVQNYCTSSPPVVPNCTGGQVWDGANCVCIGSQTWDGTQCVQASCGGNPPVTGIYKTGAYTFNGDTDCVSARGRWDFINRAWSLPDCNGADPAFGQGCADSRNQIDARRIGCGGEYCLYCQVVMRYTGCTVSGGGGNDDGCGLSSRCVQV